MPRLEWKLEDKGSCENCKMLNLEFTDSNWSEECWLRYFKKCDIRGNPIRPQRCIKELGE